MKLGAIVALAAAAAVTAGCATSKPCCQGQAAEKPVVVQQNACKGIAKCKTMKRVHNKHVVKMAERTR